MKKKEKKPIFLRCRLEKTETGIKLVGIYQTEVEKEKEVNGKKQVVKEKVEIEKTEAYLNVDELKDEIKKKLVVYGLYVKVHRANAGVKNETKRLENWKEIIEILRSGNWERKPNETKVMEKAKQELLNSIRDPELKQKLKKELGLE